MDKQAQRVMLLLLFISACSNAPERKVFELAANAKLSNQHFMSIDKIVEKKPKTSAYKISPNAKKLAWIENVNGRSILKVSTLSTGQELQLNASVVNEEFTWGDEGRYLLIPLFSNRHQVNKVGIIDTKLNTPMTLLLPFLAGNLTLEHVMFDAEVTIVLRHKTVEQPAAFYRMNLGDFVLEKIDSSDYTKEVILINGQEVFASIIKDKSAIKVKRHINGGIETVANCNDITAEIHLLSVAADDGFHYLTNCESNNFALKRANVVASNVNQHLQKLPTNTSQGFDISQVIINTKNGKPLVKILQAGYSQFIAFEDVQTNKYQQLNRLKGKCRVLSISNNNALMTIENSSYLGISYYLYDLVNDELTALSQGHLSADKSQFNEAQFVEIINTDGVTLYAYYYGAVNHRKSIKTHSFNIEPNEKAVILLHGGPETRSYAEYNRTAALLSNRGYHVLSLNYRGSKGFGHSYQRAAQQNIQVMLNDIETAKTWLQKLSLIHI